MIRMTRPEVSPRGWALLRCISSLGPLFSVQIQRALPAYAPDLVQLRTTSRSTYRELALLVKKRLVGVRRPAGARASVYHVTERGAVLLEASGEGAVDLEGISRFLARPDHEELVRALAVELVVARALHGQALRSLSWSYVERFRLPGAQGVYVPDLTAWVTASAGEEFVLLVEVDRGTEPLTRWESKLERAAPVLASCGPTGRLLVVAEGQRRLDHLADRARSALPADFLGRVRCALAGEVKAEALLEPRFVAPAKGEGSGWAPTHLFGRLA